MARRVRLLITAAAALMVAAAVIAAVLASEGSPPKKLGTLAVPGSAKTEVPGYRGAKVLVKKIDRGTAAVRFNIRPHSAFIVLCRGPGGVWLTNGFGIPDCSQGESGTTMAWDTFTPTKSGPFRVAVHAPKGVSWGFEAYMKPAAESAAGS